MAGDFIETGVWRGGVTILIRGVLAAHGITDRNVWVADSFEGLPVPDGERYTADADLDWSGVDVLKVDAGPVEVGIGRVALAVGHRQALGSFAAQTFAVAIRGRPAPRMRMVTPPRQTPVSMGSRPATPSATARRGTGRRRCESGVASHRLRRWAASHGPSARAPDRPGGRRASPGSRSVGTTASRPPGPTAEVSASHHSWSRKRLHE